MITLTLRAPPGVPLEADGLTPDGLAGRSLAEIERLPLQQGNAQVAVGDVFAVRGEADGVLRLEGDLSRVKHIGRGMTGGRLLVEGDAGMHVGAEMRGGTLQVRGDAGDWAGAEMRGGLLHVEGRAGHLLGAAYRGSPKGMRGGTILVEGSAGNEVGCTMRRGLIAVGGDVGDFAGVMMLAGTLFVFGRLGLRPGAGMRRGSLVTVAPAGAPPALLSTFRLACEYRPAWIDVYGKALAEAGFRGGPLPAGGRYRRYLGDFTELGKGEILSWTGD